MRLWATSKYFLSIALINLWSQIMVLGCTHKKASFVPLDDLENISILLEENNNFRRRNYSFI